MSSEITIVTTWDEFREKWEGGDKRQNFLLRGEIFPFQFQSPPLEQVMEATRHAEGTRVLLGDPDKASKPGHYPEFEGMSTAEAVASPALLAHFESRQFCGPGQIFGDLDKSIDGWYDGLRQHGFSWNEQGAQRAFFWSGPNCNSGYHFDSSYVLAWQIVGRKRFCWLKEPEKWCPAEVRRTDADRYDRMPCPEGITSDDVIECEMQSGDVLWNVMLTPHWVHSLDETTYSFNLTHFDVRCDGKLSAIGEEHAAIQRQRATEAELVAV